MAPFRLDAFARFSGTDTSLNIAFCWCPSKNFGTLPEHGLSLKAMSSSTSPEPWTGFCQFPFYLPMPQCNILNKLVGAKLRSEETVASWEPGSLNSILLSARAQGPSTGNTYEAFWNPEEPSKEPLPKLRTLLTPSLSRSVPLERKVLWVFLISFVKNDEIRPSISCQIILEWWEERNQLNSWKEQLVICSSAFWKQKCENLKNISLTFFKFQSTPAYSVSGQRY